MNLRDYQLEAVEAIKSRLLHSNNALVVLPTGSGKTEVIFHFMKEWIEKNPSQSIGFFTNRVNLVSQTTERASKFFDLGQVGVVCGSLNARQTGYPITIGSIQSLGSVSTKFDIIVFDEVHRLAEQDHAESAKLIRRYQEQNPDLKLIGVTATPYRATGVIYEGPKAFFDSITFSKSLLFMIENGYLVRPRLRGSAHAFDPRQISIRAGDFDQKELNELVKGGEEKIKHQCLEAINLTKDRKHCVWACISIQHAELVEAILRSQGEAAIAYHSKLKMNEREVRMKAFRSGIYRHLIFITTVAEGWDFPAADALLLMRPTRSATLMVQISGRVLRVAPDKTDAVIIDFGRVFESLGPLDAPVLPKKGEKKGDAYRDPPFKFCPKCFAYVEQKERACPECSLVFVAPKPKATSFAKNLDERAMGDVALLSDERVVKKMLVSNLVLTYQRSRAGRNMIIIKYVSRILLEAPVNEYLITSGEGWMVAKARQKLMRFGLHKDTIAALIKTPSLAKDLKLRVPHEIRYVMRGHYPEIVELVFNDTERSDYETQKPSHSYPLQALRASVEADRRDEIS